ncbi:MAG TPA: GMC family oxidoreductase [Thermoanaerobaculia bacterium]|nr:GMC family oxidoreductase [Thermoanaerobaculia bacterium]
MFQDLQQLDQTTIEADLCIIGSGPAGISIALAFAGKPIRVCLLESGGFDLEKRTQSLCKGEVAGLPYWRPLEEVRYRYFGGSTSNWGAWLAPLNEIDFHAREWIPSSGWPLSFADLEPYYARAHLLFRATDSTYDPDNVGFEPDALLKISNEGLVHRLWNFGAPARFAGLYRRPLACADNVRVILHANVTELQTDAAGQIITCVNVATLDGKRSNVRATLFVLAAGGLEVPRILLLSHTPDGVGIGNRHDLVGRFFMEHPHVNIGKVVLTGDRRWVKNYQLRRIGRRVVRPHLCLSEQKQRELQLVNCSCSLDPPCEENTSYAALRRLKKAIMDPFENGNILRDLALAVANPLDVAYGLYSKVVGSRYIPRRRAPREILLRARVEQTPIPESRLTLSEKRDELGLNLIRLDWRMAGIERDTMRVMGQLIADEFETLGLGEVHLATWLRSNEPEWPDDLWGGPHHMGTTRMNDDPTRGVVDRNSRVHGLKNLFIAGSSVFPTAGYANPTLTIVALAVRLANHLEVLLTHTSSLSHVPVDTAGTRIRAS